MAFIGTFRAQLKAAIGASVTSGALTLSAGDITVGYDHKPPSVDMFKDIGTSAAQMYIKPAVLKGIDKQSRQRQWSVEADLYFGFARETDNTMADVEGLIEAIFDRWDVAANWTGRGIPDDIRCELSADVKQSPVFAVYRIEVDVTSCG